MQHSGKHAFVTGGGTGIGLAIACALAAEGAEVTITGRRQEVLDQVAGGRIHAMAMDVTDEAAQIETIAKAVAERGPIQICVANAGIAEGKTLQKTELEFWRKIMTTNLDGCFVTIRECMKSMSETDWGRVIAVSSIAGLRGLKGAGAYSASKHGVIGLIRSYAEEHMGSSITFNAICPGYVDTDIITRNVESIKTRAGISEKDALAVMTSANQHGRLIHVDEVAESALWLCHSNSGSINGQTVEIAGGTGMTDFQWTKSQFYVPEGMIYLDGNSLGPLPLNAKDRVGASMTDQWGEMLITGWNKAGWMDMPRRVGDRIARILGAANSSIVMGDTLSIKVYQALSSALDLRPDRRVILSDSGNFPSDLYMAEGLIKSLDRDYELRVVAPEDVYDAIDDDVAVTLITEIDYRTGRRHDMQAITKRAHACGAITVWDLAHSAGAVDVDLAGANVDFAIGCTYKYLNGGPGAPAFIYVRPDLADAVRPALSGWLGHAAPFDFELNYRAGDGIDRLRVGTPPILGLVALDAALDVWDHVDIADVRARSIELSEAFVAEVSVGCPALKLASPSDPHARGSQVSYHFEQGYAAMQAMIDRKIIGDFRAPDLMRFGFTPLYIDVDQVRAAARTLCDVIDLNLWDDPKYKTRQKVT